MLTFSDENSGNISVADSYNEFHEYEIQWTPDEIRWVIDGKVGRTKKKSETWNETSSQWAFPQTPSRVQISLWPGGLESNPKGTVDWAGGHIDWNGQEIKDYGYYFATFNEVTVECYKTSKPPGTNKGSSYYYKDISATNDTVVDSNKPTVLKSLLGTGMDMDKGDGGKDDVHNIPGGGSSGNNNNNPNQVPGGGNPVGSSPGGGGGDRGSAGSAKPDCESDTGFSQSCGGGGGGGGGGGTNAGARGVDRTLGGSAFAVVVGFAALLLL
jgi:hypothetical protein